MEPGCCRDPRRLQRVRSGHGRLTRGEEPVGDPRGRRTEVDESRRDLFRHVWPQGRGDGCRQLISGGRIRESIPVRLGADHSGAERQLKQPISGPHVVTRGRGELEPIEPISEHGKPAENLGHLGGQIEDRLLINWSR